MKLIILLVALVSMVAALPSPVLNPGELVMDLVERQNEDSADSSGGYVEEPRIKAGHKN